MELKHQQSNDLQNALHLVILIAFSVFALLLVIDIILLGWQFWPIPLIIMGLSVAWFVHVAQPVEAGVRLWIYGFFAVLLVLLFTLVTDNIYDLTPTALIGILLFSLAGELGIVYLYILSYYAYFLIDLWWLSNTGVIIFDTATVSRISYHFITVFVALLASRFFVQRRYYNYHEYEEKIAELAEINHRNEDFLTNVSHELRTPINAVTGITSVILSSGVDDEFRHEIESVRQAGFRLHEQISDILDYTEIHTGKLILNEEPYMLISVLNDLQNENRSVHPEKNKVVLFDVSPDIPLQMVGDSAKLRKILRHLIDNAMKFTEEGGVYVHIYSRKKAYGVNLCISVNDTGIGIEQDEINRLTEQFYQTKGGKDHIVGGLGLGLSIVHGLVDSMGGFMQITSKPGEGTNVRLSIPQKVIDASPCIAIKNREEVCAAIYSGIDHLTVPKMKDYFGIMLVHASEGLHIPLHRIENDDQLTQLMKTYALTHLFIGQPEYEDNVTFYESLDSSIQVVVVAQSYFPLPQDSRIRIVKTPFYSFTLASVINSGESEHYFNEKQMLCPGVRVLVVDDEEMNLMVAEGIFKQYGMIVKTALSGAEAIRIVELEEFDIIFLDHMMPEMDGIETMLHLRRNLTRAGRSVSIVALTANAVSGARETFISAGFDGFLPKPIEYSELDRILKLVLPKSAITYVDKDQLAASEDAMMLLSDTAPLRQAETLTVLSEGGINTRAGIRYCKGDSNFYNELLISFAMTSVDRLRELRYFFEERNWPDYNIRVHALKSTAKMIGAERLSELARAAEEASRDANTEYLFSHQKELIRTYERTAQLIHDAVGVQAPEEETVTQEIGRKELIEKMTELISALETYEGDKATGILRSLSSCSYRGKPVSAMLTHTGLLVAEFDLKAAAADASAILKRITEGEEE